MKRFYLFLGLCCLAANSGYAVQSSQSAPRVSAVRTGKVPTKTILPLRSVNTPVLSAITSKKVTTLGSFGEKPAAQTEARFSFPIKMNKKVNSTYTTYKDNIATTTTTTTTTTNDSKNSVQTAELENKIKILQDQIDTLQKTIDNKADVDEVKQINNTIEKIEQTTNTDTIANKVLDTLASEEVLDYADMLDIELAIDKAQKDAIEAASKETEKMISEYTNKYATKDDLEKTAESMKIASKELAEKTSESLKKMDEQLNEKAKEITKEAQKQTQKLLSEYTISLDQYATKEDLKKASESLQIATDKIEKLEQTKAEIDKTKEEVLTIKNEILAIQESIEETKEEIEETQENIEQKQEEEEQKKEEEKEKQKQEASEEKKEQE